MFIHEWSSTQVVCKNVNITCVASIVSGSAGNIPVIAVGGSARNIPACFATAVSDAASLLSAVSELQATAAGAGALLGGAPLTVRIVLQQSITVRCIFAAVKG